MEIPVFDYYQALAGKYDQDRFGNSYGQYLHRQEHCFLTKKLKNTPPANTLDLACGTGRMLEFADTGLDFSPNMLEQARQKWPDKKLVCGDVENLPFPAAAFEAVYSLHLVMHLSREQTRQSLREAHRVLAPGGILVCDFPSGKRRHRFSGSKPESWHAGNSFTLEEWRKETHEQWQLVDWRGALFMPVHRVQVRFRRRFWPLDQWLCGSPLREYASYLLVCLQKL